jgi:riboflavin kinase / FMN adenylyltransferase
MKFLQTTTVMPEETRGAVLAVGNFDGVHRGHLAVLAAARKIAGDTQAPFGALTFEPHPRVFLKPQSSHFNLSSSALKQILMAALGLDVLVAASFNSEFAALSARQFAKQVLVENLKVSHIVTGPNFYFGKGREGDISTLKSLGGELGFGVEIVHQVVSDDNKAFSSTAVRDCLKQGDVRSAADILGHWWQVLGTVVEGDKRGRTIGFPTANITLDADVKPKFGVYVVRARVMGRERGRIMSGVANLGLRPTFARDNAVMEVNLFDFDGDLYGQTLLVDMISFIRPEQKFDGIEALKAQITNDAATARAVLADMQTNGDPMAAYPIGKYFAPQPS